MAYYITLFKLEGHQTWRAHFCSSKIGFELEKKNWPDKVKITATKVIRFDRITGFYDEEV